MNSRPWRKSQEDLCTRLCADAHKHPVRLFFSNEGSDKSDTILFCCPLGGLTVRVKGADQSCVNGTWSPSATTSSLQASGSQHQVQIAHHHVGCHIAPASRQMRAATLSRAFPPQDLSPITTCTVMATGIQWKATPATAQGPGKRKVKTSQEEDAEHVWLQLCDPACWASGKHQSCTSASLRPQKCLARNQGAS